MTQEEIYLLAQSIHPHAARRAIATAEQATLDWAWGGAPIPVLAIAAAQQVAVELSLIASDGLILLGRTNETLRRGPAPADGKAAGVRRRRSRPAPAGRFISGDGR